MSCLRRTVSVWGRGVRPWGYGCGVTLLPLGAAALFGDQVGGDAEEERLGVADFATGLIGRDADIGFLDNVVD